MPSCKYEEFPRRNKIAGEEGWKYEQNPQNTAILKVAILKCVSSMHMLTSVYGLGYTHISYTETEKQLYDLYYYDNGRLIRNYWSGTQCRCRSHTNDHQLLMLLKLYMISAHAYMDTCFSEKGVLISCLAEVDFAGQSIQLVTSLKRAAEETESLRE